MYPEEKEKLIDLLTDVQIRCIAYGRAVQDHEMKNTPGSKKWMETCQEKWSRAENEIRRTISNF